MLKLWFLSLIGFCCLTVCFLHAKEILDNDLYVSTKTHFKIRPPAGWKWRESGNYGLGELVAFINQKEDEENHRGYRANIQIEVEHGLSVDPSYVADDMIYKLKLYPENKWNLISHNPATIKGGFGYAFSGTLNKGQMKLRMSRLIVVNSKSNYRYIVTATALDSAWNNYKEAVTGSLDSFRLE